VRRVILNLHLFTALLAAAFIMIQGITGSILAFEPELDRAFHAHLTYVRPESQSLPLSKLGESVSQQLGGERVVAYAPSTSSNISFEVLLPSGVAYVNQHTGELLGVRARGQTFLGYVKALHVRLGDGAIGKNILRWSAVAALVSVISGLYLWWPMRRISIRAKGDFRRFSFDLHNVVGIYSMVPLTLLAASGIILGFEDQAAFLIYHLTQSNPTQVVSRLPYVAATAKPFIDVDAAVTIARSLMPGTVPYRVQMPQYGGLYRVELLDPKDRITGSRNVVALNPVDGAVVSISRAADLSRGDWILAANEAVHTGDILGLPSRIVACLTSIFVVIQALSGAFIWFFRSRTRPVVRAAS